VVQFRNFLVSNSAALHVTVQSTPFITLDRGVGIQGLDGNDRDRVDDVRAMGDWHRIARERGAVEYSFAVNGGRDGLTKRII